MDHPEKKGTFIVGSTVTSMFELEDLLQGSAEVLGKGTVGTSYKTTLESGVELVVKRMMMPVDLPREEFILRLTAIGAIQNKQIVPLHWYYWSMDEKLLVYNFISVGSLARALHGDRVSGTVPLVWEQRAAIALSAAHGVASIHSAGPSSCHGNIKSSNVMLTGTNDACLSEHGLTTLGLFPGVSGYSAPEITDANWVSQEADVYSFGVLLLELLTGKAPFHKSAQIEDRVDLPQLVCSVAQEEWVAKVIDMELLAREQKDGEEECMVRFLQLAIDCCKEDANLRPTISDLVQRIEVMTT